MSKPFRNKHEYTERKLLHFSFCGFPLRQSFLWATSPQASFKTMMKLKTMTQIHVKTNMNNIDHMTLTDKHDFFANVRAVFLCR